MRRIAVLLLLLAAPAWAGFPVQGTAPFHDNSGDCVNVILTPNLSDSVTVHISWTGTTTGQTTVRARIGGPFYFFVPMTVGRDTVVVWASDAGGAGCSTKKVYTIQDSLPPDRPTVR